MASSSNGGVRVVGSSSQLLTHNNRTSNKSALSIRTILRCIALCIASFYSGLMIGFHSADHKSQPSCIRESDSVMNYIEKQKKDKQPRVAATPLIPHGMRKVFSGMARVDRNAFFEHFDVGVPKDVSFSGNDEVLLLYSNQEALPSSSSSSSSADDATTKGEMPPLLLSASNATEHCNSLKIVLMQPQKDRECLALVGQWESSHTYKFMRLPREENNNNNKKKGMRKGGGGVDPKLPLRYVSRLHGDNGMLQRIPTLEKMKEYDSTLVNYLLRLGNVLKQLKPVAEKVAKDNTIVVMVCNFGQSELLMNFACSSRARGIDLFQVLVFATDEETKSLAEGLGMSVFYDQEMFANIPKEHAGYYADGTFAAIMMSKLYCVHMINLLGYDLLFQDVDVVWYRNPLDYFAQEKLQDFDALFQDDGSRQQRYAPFFPNTGFYFVRHNQRTEYFLHSLLTAGDIIAQSGSHQNAMVAVLNEHASWRGLHVKTLHRDEPDFIGGFHYQTETSVVENLLKGKIKPYIFHMSWTGNKDDKQKFFQQMGDWYVQVKCVGSTANMIDDSDLANACCIAEPVVQCHYRDRPSKEPCKDFPPLQKNGESWW